MATKNDKNSVLCTAMPNHEDGRKISHVLVFWVKTRQVTTLLISNVRAGDRKEGITTNIKWKSGKVKGEILKIGTESEIKEQEKIWIEKLTKEAAKNANEVFASKKHKIIKDVKRVVEKKGTESILNIDNVSDMWLRPLATCVESPMRPCSSILNFGKIGPDPVNVAEEMNGPYP